MLDKKRGREVKRKRRRGKKKNRILFFENREREGVEDRRAGRGSGTIYTRRFDRVITEREVVGRVVEGSQRVRGSSSGRGFEGRRGVEGGRIEGSRVVEGSRGSSRDRGLESSRGRGRSQRGFEGRRGVDRGLRNAEAGRERMHCAKFSIQIHG